MLLLNSFIFLFLISISALVIPSMLPNTTTIGILLLLFGLVVNLSQKLGRVSENKQPDFLKQVGMAIVEHKVDCVFTDFQLFGSSTDIWNNTICDEKEMTRRQWIPGPGTLMKKSLWKL